MYIYIYTICMRLMLDERENENDMKVGKYNCGLYICIYI